MLVAIGRGGTAPAVREAAPRATPADPLQQAILEVLGGGPASLNELVARLDASVAAASEALIALEGAAEIVRSGPWYERTGASADGGRR